MSETSNLIKDLRNKTGAGFLDCKKALLENNNNLDASIEYLRKKGLAKASKKTSREANEGAIGIYSNKNLISIIKVNSETDFAAKSETFLQFLDTLGNLILENNSSNMTKEDFLKLSYKEGKVSDYINNMIAKIGENLILNELLIFKNEDNNFSYYVHNTYKENVGKIISVINFKTNSKDDKINNLSKNICMHIAAMKPESLDLEDLDQSIIEKEKSIQKEMILSSGKPENIVDKILEGKMKKFYSEITLLNQQYILDPDKSVKEIINSFNKEYDYKIKSFHLLSM